jgi:AbrB family looped-hinge helix DNA binding protein
MAKVTSKLQVTIPKAVAERYGIEPGDDIEFVPAGDAIRVVPAGVIEPVDAERRLELFDAATRRQRARERALARRPAASKQRGGKVAERARGWTREDLYERGGRGGTG